MVHAQSECELAPAWKWGAFSRGRVRQLTMARAANTLIKKNWISPSCFIRDLPDIVTRRQWYVFC